MQRGRSRRLCRLPSPEGNQAFNLQADWYSSTGLRGSLGNDFFVRATVSVYKLVLSRENQKRLLPTYYS